MRGQVQQVAVNNNNDDNKRRAALRGPRPAEGPTGQGQPGSAPKDHLGHCHCFAETVDLVSGRE